MATQPVLGGATMPHPSEYEEVIGYYGAAQTMADASLRLELQDNSAKRRFSFTWRGLTTAQRATIITALATVATNSAILVTVTGDSYTVTRSGEPDDVPSKIVPTGNGNYRWNVGPLRLRQV